MNITLYTLRTEQVSDGILEESTSVGYLMDLAGRVARFGPHRPVRGTQLFVYARHSDGIARQIAHINPVAVSAAVHSNAHS
jgi:hypothetical protein